MSLYIITTTSRDGRIERREIEAPDAIAASAQALRSCPPGGTVAIRPTPPARYPEDFAPSVPGDFDERACLGGGGPA